MKSFTLFQIFFGDDIFDLDFFAFCSWGRSLSGTRRWSVFRLYRSPGSLEIEIFGVMVVDR
jgi:hypothetical protein